MSKKEKIFSVEYEVPPMRGISRRNFMDDGQTFAEVKEAFLADHPRARVRKITQAEVEMEDENES